MNEAMIAAMLGLQPTPYALGTPDLQHERQAARYLTKALYKEYKVGKYVRRLEKKYVHKAVKKYGAYVAIPAKVLIDRRVVFKWEF